MLTQTPQSPCVRCQTPLEAGDLRCALCGQSAPVSVQSQSTQVATILRCEGCGAAVSYDATKGAPLCSFCGSTLHMEKDEDPQEQTELYLPFTVDETQARSALRRWLGSRGFFRPKDLRTGAQVSALQPLWWVGWAFDADAWVSWAADSNAGSRRAAWAPHTGQLGLRFHQLVVSASKGLKESETHAILQSYDMHTAQTEPVGPDSALKEQFDVQRSMARQLILRRISATAAAEVQAQAIPGSRFRNVKVEPLLRSLVTRRFAFPAWVLAYRYRDRLYRAVVSGQGDGAVVADAPWSWGRIMMVAGLAAAAIAGIVYLVVTQV